MAEESKKGLKKVVVIGPESTGKSTLCRELSAHYNCLWVPEYARTFLHNIGRTYNYNDLLEIAKGQIALEERYIRWAEQDNSKLLFIDTDMYVMKVWCEFVFEKAHTWILQQIAERQYEHIFLMNIDLPWQPDELREYPDPRPREILFQMYLDCMVNQTTPWTIIKGMQRERFKAAVKVIDAMEL